jgi:spermidine/putrescine transport system ATP-binding protein
MRNGCFEQLSPVIELYERPKTSFVARFVGSANIIQGKVSSGLLSAGLLASEEGGKVLVIERPEGRVKAAIPPDLPPEIIATLKPGAPVTAAVRTEHIDLILEADAKPGEGLRAVIRDMSFAGGQLRISAILQGGGASGAQESAGAGEAEGQEIIASRHGIDSPLDVGDSVRVTWAVPEYAVLVDLGTPTERHSREGSPLEEWRL